jgi:hypothetical protein
MYNNAWSDINGNRLSSYVMPTAPDGNSGANGMKF